MNAFVRVKKRQKFETFHKMLYHYVIIFRAKDSENREHISSMNFHFNLKKLRFQLSHKDEKLQNLHVEHDKLDLTIENLFC